MPTKLEVSIGEGASKTFALQPDLFYAPSLSSAKITSVSSKANDTSGTADFQIVAVAPSASFDSIQAKLLVPTTQPLTLGPKLVETLVDLEPQGDHEYVGNITAAIDTKLLRGITVDIVGTFDGTKRSTVTDLYNIVQVDCGEFCS